MVDDAGSGDLRMSQSDDINIGRREALHEAMKYVRAQKDKTDGPQRDDWQLGFAAACREIEDYMRQMALK